MHRSRLILGALVVAGAGVTQIASADVPKAPQAQAAQSGFSVTPDRLETTAGRGATTSATVSNGTGRKLRVRVRARPWRQSRRTGNVSANRRRKLGGVRVSPKRFTLAPGAQRSVTVRLRRVPRRGSQYGGLEIVGRPVRRRKGINVVPRLVPAVRFNPSAGARRLRLRAGKVMVKGRGNNRALVLAVRNRGNTVDAVGGSVSISGSGGGRSGSATSVAILPGKRVNVRLASLSGMRRGSYRVSVTLTQAGRNILSVTRRFRIR